MSKGICSQCTKLKIYQHRQTTPGQPPSVASNISTSDLLQSSQIPSNYVLMSEHKTEKASIHLVLPAQPFPQKWTWIRPGQYPIQCILSSLSQTVSVSRGIISVASNMQGLSYDWVACRAHVLRQIGPYTLTTATAHPIHPWDLPVWHHSSKFQAFSTVISLYHFVSAPFPLSPLSVGFFHCAAIFHYFQTFQTGLDLFYDECL